MMPRRIPAGGWSVVVQICQGCGLGRPARALTRAPQLPQLSRRVPNNRAVDPGFTVKPPFDSLVPCTYSSLPCEAAKPFNPVR